MIIYANGCSHTAGTKLSMPDKSKTYPNLLAKYYNSELIDRSMAGGSNEKIVRQTISDLINFKYSNFASTPDLVILQWTDINRFETPVKIYNARFECSYDGWTQHRPLTAKTLMRYNRHEMTSKITETWYPFYSDNYVTDSHDKHIDGKLFNKYCTQIISVNSTLKQYGYRVINIAFFKFIKKNHLTKRIQEDFEWAVDPYYGFNNALADTNHDICRALVGEKVIDGHYMEDAHNTLSEWIIDYIENGNIINEKNIG